MENQILTDKENFENLLEKVVISAKKYFLSFYPHLQSALERPKSMTSRDHRSIQNQSENEEQRSPT